MVPTMSSSSLYVASAANKFRAWLPIRFFETMDRQSVTYASYPNVRIRAMGIFSGRSVAGHGASASGAVQVLSPSPLRAWTKLKLAWGVGVAGARVEPRGDIGEQSVLVDGI